MKTLDKVLIDLGLSVSNNEHDLGNGKTLLLDTLYKPTEYAKIFGDLHCECLHLPDVQVGDRIYYSYTYSEHQNRLWIDNKYLLPVPANELFCYVHDEKINMLNDYIFVEPAIIENEDLERMKKLGIEVQSSAKKDKNRGIIRHCADESMVGVECVFNGRLEAFENEIEGTVYYTMKLADCHPVKEVDNG